MNYFELRYPDRVRVYYYKRRKVFYDIVDKPWYLALQIAVQVPMVALFLTSYLLN